jgi:hypothetical protein
VLFLQLYLIAYFLLIGGAGLALWESGVLAQLPPGWLAIAVLITVALGVVLALSARRPTASIHK